MHVQGESWENWSKRYEYKKNHTRLKGWMSLSLFCSILSLSCFPPHWYLWPILLPSFPDLSLYVLSYIPSILFSSLRREYFPSVEDLLSTHPANKGLGGQIVIGTTYVCARVQIHTHTHTHTHTHFWKAGFGLSAWVLCWSGWGERS